MRTGLPRSQAFAHGDVVAAERSQYIKQLEGWPRFVSFHISIRQWASSDRLPAPNVSGLRRHVKVILIQHHNTSDSVVRKGMGSNPIPFIFGQNETLLIFLEVLVLFWRFWSDSCSFAKKWRSYPSRAWAESHSLHFWTERDSPHLPGGPGSLLAILERFLQFREKVEKLPTFWWRRAPETAETELESSVGHTHAHRRAQNDSLML